MRPRLILAAALFLTTFLAPQAQPAVKPHIIGFGKSVPVKIFASADDKNPLELKVRPLYIDTRVREYTVGSPHDITDRLFAVRRAFRLNDSLPDESNSLPRWQWQRGAWLLVDRTTGRISQINLPEFDPSSSAASWYRDYVAYCGPSDDGKNLFALVVQVGRRKPVMRKTLDGADSGDDSEPQCPAPAWQRDPIRVTFVAPNGRKQTFSLRGHVVDLVSDQEDEADNSD